MSRLLLSLVLILVDTPISMAHSGDGFTARQKQHAIAERQILKRAHLGDLRPDGTRRYIAQGGMRVNAGLKRTRKILTDFALYSKIIPYVSRAQFDPKESVLWLEGSVLKYRLSSWIRFTPEGDPKDSRKYHFRFVAGHFQGMEGDLEFEDLGERGTWVTANSEYFGKVFAPRIVIENGAQFVFGYTATRMRTFIEREFQSYEEEDVRKAEEKRQEKREEEQKKGSAKTFGEEGAQKEIPRPRKTFPRPSAF